MITIIIININLSGIISIFLLLAFNSKFVGHTCMPIAKLQESEICCWFYSYIIFVSRPTQNMTKQSWITRECFIKGLNEKSNNNSLGRHCHGHLGWVVHSGHIINRWRRRWGRSRPEGAQIPFAGSHTHTFIPLAFETLGPMQRALLFSFNLVDASQLVLAIGEKLLSYFNACH